MRLPFRYYSQIMIGKMSKITTFTEELLKKIGAWNDTVKTWLSLPTTNSSTRYHGRDARHKLLTYYNRTMEDMVFSLYSKDYEIFAFDKT